MRKQLRVLQQDKKFKDEVGSIQDGRIIELENKVGSLKARIRILIDKKIPIDNLDMANDGIGQGPIKIIWTIGIGLIGLVQSKSNCIWTLMAFGLSPYCPIFYWTMSNNIVQ